MRERTYGHPLVVIRDRRAHPADPVVLVGIPYQWMPVSEARALPGGDVPVVATFSSTAKVYQFLATFPAGWWLGQLEELGALSRVRVLRRTTVGV